MVGDVDALKIAHRIQRPRFIPTISLPPPNIRHAPTSHTRAKCDKFTIAKSMLGKCSRPNFRRTSSMSRLAIDAGSMEAAPPSATMIGGEFCHMLSPRYLRNAYSGDFHVETADFLRSCGLCNRRLAPGHDIYMYRGDTAFCSIECREQQMKQDEKKERRAAAKSGDPELVAAAGSGDGGGVLNEIKIVGVYNK